MGVRLTRGVQRAAAVGEEEGRAGEQRAGPRAGLLHASWAGRLLLRARWEAAAMGLVGLASLGRAAGCEAHFFFSLFLFFISFPLFGFKFGLEFEFKTEVAYSLEFREFCLIISLWFIILLELFSKS